MNAMMRNIVGSLLALVGAAAAVWSPFRAWYEGRQGRDFRLTELFTGTGISDGGADLLASPFLPFAIAAVLTVAAIVLRSRALQALAAITVLGFTALWMVRQAMADGSLTFAGDGTGVDHGIGLALGGGALMLLAAGVMGGRRKRSREDHGRPEEAGWEPVEAAREHDEVHATSATNTMPQHTTWTDGAGTGRYWQGEPTDHEEYEYPQAGHGRHRSATTSWGTGSGSGTGVHSDAYAADHRSAKAGHRRKWPKIPQNH